MCRVDVYFAATFFFLDFYAPQDFEIGECKMKYNNYTDLGIVSSKKPTDLHLFFEINSGFLYLVDSADRTKFYKSLDKGDNWTQVDVDPNDSSGDNKSRDFGTFFAWHDRANTIIYLLDFDNVGDTLYPWKIDYSDDTVTDLGSIAKTDIIPSDIFIIGSDIFVFVYHKNAGQDQFEIFKWVDPNWVSQDTHNLANLYFGNSGVVVGNLFYFRVEDAANDETYIYSYTHATTTIAQLLDVGNYDNPDEEALGAMTYDNKNILGFVVKDGADHKLVSYNISGNSAIIGGIYNIALMLDRNTASGVMEKAFHLTEYKVYQIQENKLQLYLISIVASDAVLIAITDNFLMNDDGDMSELVDSINKLTSLKFSHEIMSGSFGHVTIDKDSLTLEENMLLIFTHNYTTAGATSEKTVFEGMVVKPSEDLYQTILLLNPGTKELRQVKPRGDYSGRSDEIITSLLSDYTNYITKGTFSAGSAMGTITFGGDKTLETILDELAYFEGWIWYLTPTGALYFNNGTVDSTINFTGASDIRAVLSSFLHEEYNKIKVRGAYVDGVQVESEWKEDLDSQQRLGIVDKIIPIAFLNTVALCNTAATNILTRLGTPPKRIEFIDFNTTTGMIQVGETTTFEYDSGITIGSGQFLISSVDVNIVGEVNYTEVDKVV